MIVSFKDQLLAAAASAFRVFIAASAAAYAALGKAPDEIGWEDLKGFAWAGVFAVALTIVNWARKGETRFGVNAQPEQDKAPEPTGRHRADVPQ
jgi:hypothetical protein